MRKCAPRIWMRFDFNPVILSLSLWWCSGRAFFGAYVPHWRSLVEAMIGCSLALCFVLVGACVVCIFLCLCFCFVSFAWWLPCLTNVSLLLVHYILRFVTDGNSSKAHRWQKTTEQQRALRMLERQTAYDRLTTGASMLVWKAKWCPSSLQRAADAGDSARPTLAATCSRCCWNATENWRRPGLLTTGASVGRRRGNDTWANCYC